MKTEDIFESSVRSKGDLAGVFEYADDVGYFYLCRVDTNEGYRIIESLCVGSDFWEVAQSDVSVRWDAEELRTGLLVKGVLWAVFDSVSGRKYGSDYNRNRKSDVPPEVETHFYL